MNIKKLPRVVLVGAICSKMEVECRYDKGKGAWTGDVGRELAWERAAKERVGTRGLGGLSAELEVAGVGVEGVGVLAEGDSCKFRGGIPLDAFEDLLEEDCLGEEVEDLRGRGEEVFLGGFNSGVDIDASENEVAVFWVPGESGADEEMARASDLRSGTGEACGEEEGEDWGETEGVVLAEEEEDRGE